MVYCLECIHFLNIENCKLSHTFYSSSITLNIADSRDLLNIMSVEIGRAVLQSLDRFEIGTLPVKNKTKKMRKYSKGILALPSEMKYMVKVILEVRLAAASVDDFLIPVKWPCSLETCGHFHWFYLALFLSWLLPLNWLRLLSGL